MDIVTLLVFVAMGALAGFNLVIGLRLIRMNRKSKRKE